MWYHSVNRTGVPGGLRDMSALADYITRWLRQRGLGQNQLASRAKIRPSTLSNIMTKEGILPKPKTVKQLASAMGVDGSVLTALIGYPIAQTTDPSDRHLYLARQLDAFPWLTERLDDLMRVSDDEFRELMDYLQFRHRDRSDDQSSV